MSVAHDLVDPTSTAAAPEHRKMSPGCNRELSFALSLYETPVTEPPAEAVPLPGFRVSQGNNCNKQVTVGGEFTLWVW